MRFAFRSMPERGGVRPRPIVDIVVDGFDIAPQACLLDSGATAVRMGAHVADMAGIDLTGAPRTRIAVGGAAIDCRVVDVALEIGGLRRWEAPVWFCDPWAPAFGLLGLTGFFDHFRVTLSAYEEWFELTPLG